MIPFGPEIASLPCLILKPSQNSCKHISSQFTANWFYCQFTHDVTLYHYWWWNYSPGAIFTHANTLICSLHTDKTYSSLGTQAVAISRLISTMANIKRVFSSYLYLWSIWPDRFSTPTGWLSPLLLMTRTVFLFFGDVTKVPFFNVLCQLLRVFLEMCTQPNMGEKLAVASRGLDKRSERWCKWKWGTKSKQKQERVTKTSENFENLLVFSYFKNVLIPAPHFKCPFR